MVIGDVNTETTPAPPEGAVTFHPISEPNPVSSAGTLYYDSGTQSFKYSNGSSSWQDFGGGTTGGLYGYCRDETHRAISGGPITSWDCRPSISPAFCNAVPECVCPSAGYTKVMVYNHSTAYDAYTYNSCYKN